MNLELFVNNSKLLTLLFARIFAIVQLAPLLSSKAVAPLVKVALSFFTAMIILPYIRSTNYFVPESALAFVMLMVGELLIGILIGFYLMIIYSIFLISGQFFSLQMGLGASQVFDPLAQVQIPLMGQFLNVIAMFVFISVSGFKRIFLVGITGSFEKIRVIDFVTGKDHVLTLIINSLGNLFEQALIISLPILGTLFMISVTMGLFAKAAPQMNLLMMGFPISISVAFLIIFSAMPFIIEAFANVIDKSFLDLLGLFRRMSS